MNRHMENVFENQNSSDIYLVSKWNIVRFSHTTKITFTALQMQVSNFLFRQSKILKILLPQRIKNLLVFGFDIHLILWERVYILLTACQESELLIIS